MEGKQHTNEKTKQNGGGIGFSLALGPLALGGGGQKENAERIRDTIYNATGIRFCVKIAASMSLALAHISVVGAQAPSEFFDDKLRKAAEAYAKKSQAEEAEQKRLVAAFAAKREAMQKQEEAERRQAELAFKERIAARKLEEAARLRELEAKLKGNEEQLAKAVADCKGRMLAKEAESERAFTQKRERFSQELKAKVSAELPASVSPCQMSVPTNSDSNSSKLAFVQTTKQTQ